MPKEKRSFFGKIIGSQNEDADMQPVSSYQAPDNDDVEDEDMEDLTDPEILEEEVIEEEEGIAVEVPVDAPESKPAPVRTEVSQHEEWLSDYEGQLNIDMYQTKDNVIIKSTIAGVRPEDMDITVANDMVTIKGARKREEAIGDDDYFYQECYWGNFSRSVIIPVDIDSEHIEADLKDGILTVVVPKAAKAKTKKIKVKGL